MPNKMTLLEHLRAIADASKQYCALLIGECAGATADAIEEVQKSIPTKTSDLENDSGFLKSTTMTWGDLKGTNK